jgi:hypothetical protein
LEGGWRQFARGGEKCQGEESGSWRKRHQGRLVAVAETHRVEDREDQGKVGGW